MEDVWTSTNVQKDYAMHWLHVQTAQEVLPVENAHPDIQAMV